MRNRLIARCLRGMAKVDFSSAKNQTSEEGSQPPQGKIGALARTCRIPSTRRSSKARGGSRANGAFGTRRSGPQSDSTDCGPIYINGSGVFSTTSDSPPLIGPHLLSRARFGPASARKRITQSLLLGCLLGSLAGCGGGGSSDNIPNIPDVPPVTTSPAVPESETQWSRFDPVNGLEINEAFMDGFLAAIKGPVDYPDTQQMLKRWRRPPVIKYAPSLARYSAVAVEYLRFAVAELNDALPPEMEVKWGGAWNAPLDSLSEEDFEGLIVVGIGDFSEILFLPDGTALLGVSILIPSNRATLDGGVIVGVDPATTRLARQTDYEVFVHEMIHSLGLFGHVPSGRYGPDELMDNRARLARSVKPHNYLSLVHHYDPNYLGGWNGDYELLRGDTGDVGYEVWIMNDTLAWPIYGFGQDWTGTHPRELGGSASWRGGLVGYTSGRRFVEGTSALDYDFHVDRLSANFTWDGGGVANYHRVETGALGTLYAEDARGTMHGLFMGDDHEYVSGSLDRTDITAAFGAERRQ